jgi:hypothetical protein
MTKNTVMELLNMLMVIAIKGLGRMGRDLIRGFMSIQMVMSMTGSGETT